MMRELADNILDIAQNAVAAKATLLEITLALSTAQDRITLQFCDNGCGMSPEMVSTVADPFTTTRKTRKVGLGLPLLKQTALMTGGTFDIESEVGRGTKVSVSFGLSHIDRPPLGDVAAALYTLVLLNPHMDFVFDCRCDERSFVFDTRVIRKTIEPLEIDCPEVSEWVQGYLNQEIQLLLGGNIA